MTDAETSAISNRRIDAIADTFRGRSRTGWEPELERYCKELVDAIRVERAQLNRAVSVVESMRGVLAHARTYFSDCGCYKSATKVLSAYDEEKK
jgi:hypothetical protein